MAQLNYNPAEVPADERGEITLMPEGEYLFLVTSSELKDGKIDSTNKRLVFDVSVQGPTHKGQKLWPDFNIVNKSGKAQEIGRQQLNKFSDACGVPSSTLRDSSQLHNKLFKGKVVVIPAEGKYQAKNEIKYFNPAGTQPVPRPQAQAPAQQSLPATGGEAAPQAPAGDPAAPPWMKRG